MYKQIIDHLRNYEQFSDEAFIIGIKTNSIIDKNTALNGITKLGKRFSDLNQIETDEKNNTYSLRNGLLGDRQKLIGMSDFRRIKFAWAKKATMNFIDDSKDFFDIIQKDFNIQPISVEQINISFFVQIKFDGDHSWFINEIFYNKSPIKTLFPKNHFYNNSIEFHGTLNSDLDITIGIDSDQNRSSIMKKDYSEKYLLASCAISQINNIPLDAILSELFIDHCETAFKYMKEKFIPNILEPINNYFINK